MHGGQQRTELSEAIEAVRQGLEEAASQGTGRPVRFQVREIELEFAVELRRTGSVGGGVRAWVVSGDSRRERSSGRTHRMKVLLNVLDDKVIGSQPEDGNGAVNGHPGANGLWTAADVAGLGGTAQEPPGTREADGTRGPR